MPSVPETGLGEMGWPGQTWLSGERDEVEYWRGYQVKRALQAEKYLMEMIHDAQQHFYVEVNCFD